MQEDNFKSLNMETGLLEDPDEIRHLAVELAQIIQSMLKHPLLRVVLPPEILQGTAAYAVKAESTVRPMSQREQYLLMNAAVGTPLAAIKIVEDSVGGLSDTLPATHPAVRGRLLQGMLSSPEIPEDMKELARREQAEEELGQVELPQSIDEFLKSLADQRHPGEGEKPEGE